MKPLNFSYAGLSKYFLLCLYVPLFLSSSECKAQDNKSKSFILYMDAPSMSRIKTERAGEIDIAQNIWTADFGMELRIIKYAVVSSGIGLGSVKDHQPFSQNTTIGKLKSSFNVTSFEIKGGLWFPQFAPLKKRDLQVNLRTNLGYEGMKGKREIDGCTNCTEEKYKFSPGLFVEPEVNLYFFQNLFGIGTAYRHYISDSDIKYKITLLKLMIRIDS